MKRLALSAAFLLLPSILAGQSTPSGVWKATPPIAQQMYVLGLVDGMIATRIAQGDDGPMPGASSYVRRAMLQLPIADDDALRGVVGQLYENPANAYVSPMMAVVYAGLTLDGASESDLAHILTLARRQGAERRAGQR